MNSVKYQDIRSSSIQGRNGSPVYSVNTGHKSGIHPGKEVSALKGTMHTHFYTLIYTWDILVYLVHLAVCFGCQ